MSGPNYKNFISQPFVSCSDFIYTVSFLSEFIMPPAPLFWFQNFTSVDKTVLIRPESSYWA